MGVGVGHGEEATEHSADGSVPLGNGGAGVEVLGEDLAGRHSSVDRELTNSVKDVITVEVGADRARVLVAGAGRATLVAALDSADAAADEAEEGGRAEDRAFMGSRAGRAEDVVAR